MISKILVPTDFSQAAENAMDYAIGFAQKTKASIHLLHINQVALVDASMPAESYQMFVKEQEDFTAENFERLGKKLKEKSVNFTLSSHYGFVADEICHYAHTENADLILMGTTGSSGISEILVGSNAASVVAKTEVPVLVIPPSCVYKDPGRIVYASDYNEPETYVLRRLVYFAELFDCPLDVIHVKSENDKYFKAENNFFKRNKSEISYPQLQFIELEKGEIIASINEYVDGVKADLLVMAKHNRSFFDRLFHRSMSKKMAYHTHVPLLILVKDQLQK
ncbi:MAG: universal stress protein [Bacteroidetes bacterium]|nr:universal stress protein [Bacteroidota bacterium]MCK6610488.1 universal stress protein [Bacteroidia bacterium]